MLGLLILNEIQFLNVNSTHGGSDTYVIAPQSCQALNLANRQEKPKVINEGINARKNVENPKMQTFL